MIGLPQVLAELVMLDLTAIGTSSDLKNGYVDRQSCQTPILIIFDWQLSLVLLLISVSRGEDIKF